MSSMDHIKKFHTNLEYVDLPKFPILGHAPKEGQFDNGWVVPQEELQVFDPRKYFATSGEAVAKSEKMLKDAWLYVGKLQSFANKLKKAKGAAKYLEVAWQGGGTLVVQAKNPRVFKEKKHDGKKFEKVKARSSYYFANKD